ncbi:hypothetical protein [Coleofasciculus sp. FACHB-SPT9]|uniref:hypothetical protein n=1 Tax=Cyanophyceae TaxID=3028117 RepID=UPI00168646EF|nr:hypothetical protein [Coleofasciculus sp. FACHB-SPT9]MBD1889494.1 hypothetical protein [Coleofasciculus sp. FACHB-SPT9]
MSSDMTFIQNGQWLPELSHFVPINTPPDVDKNLDLARDQGENIELFLHTALNPHVPALVVLGEFLQSKELTILAATFRAFASIGEKLEGKNLPPAYQHHLANLQWTLTQNLNLTCDDDSSVALFKRLCYEAESGTSDLTRWAAAYAIEKLNYPASLRRQLLDRPPAEITADIERKYVSCFSERNNPLENRDYIKFWTYGPTEILFSKCNPFFGECNETYYLDVVREVLSKLGVRGIRLALKNGNRASVKEAIHLVSKIFHQVSPSESETRYIDRSTRQRLADFVLPFLDKNDIELQNLVADILNDKAHQYQASNVLLDQNNCAKVAVLALDWQRVRSLGKTTLPFLYEAIKGQLKFDDNERRNLDCQLEVVRNIDKILTNINSKIINLVPYLQHDVDEIRSEVANVLMPHISSNLFDPSSLRIIKALQFNIDFKSATEIESLNQSEIKTILEQIKEFNLEVTSTFDSAIFACSANSFKTKSFLEKRKSEWLSNIQHYADSLVARNQKIINNFENQVLCSKLLRKKADLEASIKSLEKEIQEQSNLVQKYLGQGSSIGLENTFQLLLWAIFAAPILLLLLFAFIRVVVFIIIAAFCNEEIVSACGTEAWNRYSYMENLLFCILWAIPIIFSLFHLYLSGKSEHNKTFKKEINAKVKKLQNQKKELEQELYRIVQQISNCNINTNL